MSLRQTERKRTGSSPTLGLLLLSALWAIAWMRNDLFPHLDADVLSPAQGQAAVFSIFAAVAASIALARRIEFPRGRRAWASAGIGVGLFVVPAGLAACAHGWVSQLDQIAVFSLTPIFAIVLEPYLQDNALRQGKSALAGALAAITGILCLFPLDLPGSFRAGVAWCSLLGAVVSIAATNCLAVRLAQSLPERSTLPIAAQAGAASTLYFVAVAASAPRIEWRWRELLLQLLWILLIDLPALFLLFWLMRRLAASRMTARFLLAPLFATLAGIALEPTSLPMRALLGFALLAAGAGWLIFAPAETTDERRPHSLTVLPTDLPRQPPTEP
jgi:drug/metabolite transporter (DMT)-like permease